MIFNFMSFKDFICFLVIVLIGSTICAQINPDCNEDDCGPLDPSWQLDGGENTVACEGITFLLRSGESVPYDNIELYNWILTNSETKEELLNVVYQDTIPLSYTPEFSDLLACLDDKINIKVRLVVISGQCAEGQSCRYTEEPLSVILKPRARFDYNQIVCVDNEVAFKNMSCNADEVFWEFGNGMTSENFDETIQYPSPGTYNVTLTAINECGSDQIQRTVTVVDYPSADINYDVAGGELCGPGPLTVSAAGNEWFTGPSSGFSWEITPPYDTTGSGSWCFENPDQTGTCLPDSLFTEFTLDSLLMQEHLDLFFKENDEYVFSLNYTNACGEFTVTDTVIVYEQPSVTGIDKITGCDEVEVCFEDLDINPSGDYSDLRWSFTNTSPSNSDQLDFGCITFNQSSQMSLNIFAEAPCLNKNFVVDVVVVNTQNISIPNPDPEILCNSSDPILLLPSASGGSYFINQDTAQFIRNDTLYPESLPPGTYSIDYILSENPDCPAQDTFSFTIQEGPFVELAELDPACEEIINYNPEINNSSGDIDSWSWALCDTLGTQIITATGQNPELIFSQSGVYQLKVNVTSDECGTVSDDSELIIQEKEEASIITFQNPYCQGSPPDTLQAQPPGGEWSGEGITDSTLGIFDPSSLSPGNYEVSYSIVNGACTSITSQDIEIVASQTVMTQDTFACFDGSPFNLIVNPSGGEFSGLGIIDNFSGVFNPSLAEIGINTINYIYTDVNGCEIASNIIVEVDTLPELDSGSSLSLCIDDDDINLIQLLDFPEPSAEEEFEFKGSGVVEPNSGIFNSGNLSPGTYIIDYSYAGRSCNTTGQIEIEIVEKQVLSLPGDTLICASDSIIILEANIPGGEWSSSSCNIDPNTGEIQINGLGDLDCEIIYTINSGNSCEQSESLLLSIIDLQDDLNVPTDQSLCYSNSFYSFQDFEPSGGTWSGESLVDNLSGTIDVSQLNPDSTYVYTYCINSPEIDCEACTSTRLKIESLPVADFALPDTLCVNEEVDIANLSEGSASYFWTMGEGSMYSTQQVSHTYVTSGEYTISLITENNFGCKDTIVKNIFVLEPPVLELDIFTDEGCAPLEIEYSNNSSGVSFQSYWTIDGIDTLRSMNPNIVLDSVLTDSLITLQYVIQNSCQTLSSEYEVLVHPYPIADFGFNDDEGCSPDTVFFANITSGNPDIIFWDFGNGQTSTEYDPSFQIYSTPDDSISIYTVSLNAENECGNDFLEKTLEVFPNNVEAFFEIDTLMGCPPLTIGIENYATPGSSVYYDFGNGTSTNSEVNLYTYEQSGQFQITQYASLCGTDSIKSQQITVYDLPEIEFEIPNSVCPGDTIQIINNSTNASAFSWSFGDGNSSNTQSPSHVYDQAGEYLISLTAFSVSHSCPDTLSKRIIVREKPIPDFISNTMVVCAGDSISFSNTSIGANNYVWEFGDGFSSTESNPVHIFYIPGVFPVNLLAVNEFGCQESFVLQDIRVNPNPVADFSIPTTEFCQFHDTLSVQNLSTGAIHYNWTTNSGSSITLDENLLLYSDEVESIQVKLVVENTFGCLDSLESALTVLPSPIAFPSYTDTSGCQILELEFQDLSENSDQTNWIFDGNNTSTSSVEDYAFLQSGNYKVLLIAGNSNKCPSDTSIINVEVYPRAVSKFLITELDSCQSNSIIQIQNSSLNSSDYEWSLSTGAESNAFEPEFQLGDPEDYSIRLVTNNINNCPDTSVQEFTVFPQPIASFELPDFCVCAGDSIQITNTSINATNFNYILNGSAIVESPLIINDSGSYRLTMIASFGDKCFDTLSNSVNIDVYTSPISAFASIINEDEYIIGDVQFVNNSILGEEYLWDFGDGATSEEISPFHEYDINGPLSVCLYSYNYNNGSCTCSDKATQIIDLERINTFFVPNALSPDQNFGNEEASIFKPKGIGIEAYELIIYSPWGDIIATLNEVVKGSPVDHWDGTFQGEPVPQGAYLWKANINYIGGHYESKNGTVTVIR